MNFSRNRGGNNLRKITYIENFDTWKDSFSFSIDIDIRFSEVDMFGHMNNVASFAYFEEARIKLMQHVGIYTEFNGNEVPVVGDLQCDYHKQVYFGETLTLYVKIASIGNSSMDIHYMGVKPDGQVALTGRGVVINMDKKSGRSAPISDEYRQKIEQSMYHINA